MDKSENIQYRFFIGHNNKTKKCEYQKAIRTLNQNNIKGFSLIKNVSGFWEMGQEKSFIIEIIANDFNPFNDDLALKVKTELEKNLKQFLVLTSKQKIELLG